MDIQKKIDEDVAGAFKGKLELNILLVSDETSRLSVLRGHNALSYFKKSYQTLADVTLVSMTSSDFCRLNPDLTKYNVLWVDNVINERMNFMLIDKLDDYASELVGRNVLELSEAEQVLARKLRSLNLRVVYALDEFVWDAPAGRAKTIGACRIVEDAMIIADSVLTPNAELQSALLDMHLVAEDKDVISIPTFVTDQFYPIHRMFERSCNYATSIRNPKILIKGTVIPPNVQQFIVDAMKPRDQRPKVFGTDYQITISSVIDLRPEIYQLIKEGKITILQHWASPYIKQSNVTETMAYERDCGFDFVINTIPNDIDSNPYEITNLDTDCVMAVAEGAVAIAGVRDAGYSAENHICVASNLVFGKDSTTKDIASLIENWRIVTNWDAAYKKQRALLREREIGSRSVMGGLFHAMLGRTLSEQYAHRIAETVESEKKKAAEAKKEK